MAVIANRIKGFADMYPPQSSLFTRMENTAREIYSRYGFAPSAKRPTWCRKRCSPSRTARAA